MPELTTEMLRTLEPHDLAALLPAPVQIGDRTGMVLRLADTNLVEVYQAGTITFVDSNVLEVEPITDPALLEETLLGVVEALTICRRVSVEAHAEQRQAHTDKLAAIRQYAIDRMEQGVICGRGLDAFLSAFDLEPYSCRSKVSYTIHGSYEVDTSTPAAIRDAKDNIRPDLVGLYEVDDQTVTYTLDVSAGPL